MNLSFLSEVDLTDEEIKEVLQDEPDLLTLYQILQKKSGVEAFYTILAEFSKTKVIFNQRPIDRFKRKFVEHKKTLPAHVLARRVELHERTVQNWLQDLRNVERVAE